MTNVDVQSWVSVPVKFLKLVSSRLLFKVRSCVSFSSVDIRQNLSSVVSKVHQESINESLSCPPWRTLVYLWRVVSGVSKLFGNLSGDSRVHQANHILSVVILSLIVSNFQVFVHLLAPRIEHVSQFSGKILTDSEEFHLSIPFHWSVLSGCRIWWPSTLKQVFDWSSNKIRLIFVCQEWTDSIFSCQNVNSFQEC